MSREATSVHIDGAGNVYYINDEDTLYRFKGEDKKEMVMRDVYSLTSGRDNTLYALDYSDNLYVIKGNKEAEKIDKNVKTVTSLMEADVAYRMRFNKMTIAD